MKKAYQCLLIFVFIANVANAQYNNIKADQLKIINQKFISVPNQWPFGKDYSSGDQYYILEYDASEAILYGFTEDDKLNSAARYKVAEKDNNTIIIEGNVGPKQFSVFNYLDVGITVTIDIESGLLSFSFFDNEFENESLICTLKIMQINLDVDRLKY